MDLLCFCSVLFLLCLCARKFTVNLSYAATQEDQKLVFKTNDRLAKVLSIAECFKGSILQYF